MGLFALAFFSLGALEKIKEKILKHRCKLTFYIGLLQI